MVAFLIGVLMILSGFLGIRLQAAHVENSSLRANVAILKRRLDER
jgi:hypothetical protein